MINQPRDKHQSHAKNMGKTTKYQKPSKNNKRTNNNKTNKNEG